jgi:hypothetical protein
VIGDEDEIDIEIEIEIEIGGYRGVVRCTERLCVGGESTLLAL